MNQKQHFKSRLFAAGFLGLSLYFLYWQFTYNIPVMNMSSFIQIVKENIYWPFLGNFKRAIWNPFFLAGVVTILTLERMFPANPRQKIFSTSLIQDFLWLLLDTVLRGSLILLYIQWMQSIYQSHFKFLTIEAVREMPYWLRIVWGIVIGDFFFWFHHWVRHKVPWFWHFHVIHHSQKDLNQFSDVRYHMVEYIITITIETIPLLILSIDTPHIVLIEIILIWHTRLYHSNIKTNFGILRYVLVTPQSHRVHHSIEPKHRDKNFGVHFSVWDQLFGTQYKGWEEYPETGVEDPLFPYDSNRRGIEFITTMIAQLIYPFRKIAQSICRIIEK